MQAGIRSCIVTRERSPKGDLLRLVLSPTSTGSGAGKIVIDWQQNVPGRGGYIKNSRDLLELACKRGAVSRALRLKRRVSEAETAQLLADFDSKTK